MKKSEFIEKFNEEIAKSGIISKINSKYKIWRYDVNDTEGRIGLNIVNDYYGRYAVCVMPAYHITANKNGEWDPVLGRYNPEKGNTSEEYNHAVSFINRWKNKNFNMLEGCFVRNKRSIDFPENDFYFQKDYEKTMKARFERCKNRKHQLSEEYKEFENVPAICFYLEENREYSQEELETLISEVYFVISSLREEYLIDKQLADCFGVPF